jgi:hypothetical protein
LQLLETVLCHHGFLIVIIWGASDDRGCRALASALGFRVRKDDLIKRPKSTTQWEVSLPTWAGRKRREER